MLTLESGLVGARQPTSPPPGCAQDARMSRSARTRVQVRVSVQVFSPLLCSFLFLSFICFHNQVEPAAASVIDEAVLVQLISMGFSENGSKRAMIATGSSDPDTIMIW